MKKIVSIPLNNEELRILIKKKEILGEKKIAKGRVSHTPMSKIIINFLRQKNFFSSPKK